MIAIKTQAPLTRLTLNRSTKSNALAMAKNLDPFNDPKKDWNCGEPFPQIKIAKPQIR